jgi:hypothetical protein
MTAALSTLKQLPLGILRQPMWFATLASLGLHGVLALLPSEGELFTRSPQIDTPVEVVELTPAEQAQLPDFVLSPPEDNQFDFGAFDDLAQFDDAAPLPTPSDPLPAPNPSPGGSALDNSWLRRYRTGSSPVDPGQLWRRLQQETARQNRNTGRSPIRMGTPGDRPTSPPQDTRDPETSENPAAPGSATDSESDSTPGAASSTRGSATTDGDRTAPLPSAEERQAQLRQGFVYDGTGVDNGRNQVAQSRLTALQAEGGLWSDRLSNERMTDQEGNPESRFWVAVNPDEPLPIPYPAGILSLLDPAPQVLRIAVLVGPEGRPTPETAPEILSSSGYAALDAQAQKTLIAALQDQDAPLTDRPGYRVYIYWLQFEAVGGDRPPTETPESPESRNGAAGRDAAGRDAAGRDAANDAGQNAGQEDGDRSPAPAPAGSSAVPRSPDRASETSPRPAPPSTTVNPNNGSNNDSNNGSNNGSNSDPAAPTSPTPTPEASTSAD